MDDLDWTLISTRVALQDEWMTLRANRYRLPDGEHLSPVYIHDEPDWVNVFGVTEADEVVLVRQFRPGAGQVLLELPCGCIEDDDASPEEAMRRELLAETGYSAPEFLETAVLSANSANHSNKTHCFFAWPVTRVGRPELRKRRQVEVVLEPLDDFIARLKDGETMQALHTVSALMGLRRLGRLRIR
jgi:8-oxo-dGTP pyrophosphatase MutT (NUDIX family)